MSMLDHDENQEEMEEFTPEPIGDESLSEDSRNALIINVLNQIHDSTGHLIELLQGGESASSRKRLAALVTSKSELVKQLEDVSGSRVVEGVFDGVSMIGSDGKAYTVPPNYASKSRLIEGDVMKLTIKADGSFVFKQIGPVERKRIVGTLAFDASTSSYVALSEGSTYKVLTASVTYYKGQPGDEVVLLVPHSGKCVWASVENVIRK